MERLYTYAYVTEKFTITVRSCEGFSVMANTDYVNYAEIMAAYRHAQFVLMAFNLYECVQDVLHGGGGEIDCLKDAPNNGLQIVKSALGDFEEYGFYFTHPQLADFMRAVAQEVKRIETPRAPKPVKDPYRPARTMQRHGYVYLLQSPTSAYKIGKTKNPKDRATTFSVLMPFEVEFIVLIPADDMHALERELHNHFAHKRVNGEWFNLAPDDVEYIKSLAVQS